MNSRYDLFSLLARYRTMVLLMIGASLFSGMSMNSSMAQEKKDADPMKQRISAEAPETGPSRDPADFWGVKLEPNDPILVWHEAIKDFARENDAFGRLSREQDNLTDRLRAEATNMQPGYPTLPGIRHIMRRGRVIGAMHANQQKVEKIEQNMNAIAKRVVDNAPKIHQRLSEIQDELDRRSQDKSPIDKRVAERRKEMLNGMIRLMDVIENDPDHALEKTTETMRWIAQFRERRSPSLALQQIEEQMNRLQREQAFLRQRLDAYDASLQSLKTQMQMLSNPPRPARSNAP